MGPEFKNFHTIILLSLCVLHLSSCASLSKKSSVENKDYPVRVEESSARNEKVFKSEVSSTIDLVVDHKFFKIVYDPDTRLAKYVSYDLKSSDPKMKSYKRKDRFREDPILVKKGIPTSKPSEYTKSGYDKGHLAPSADFSWNEEANDLTFVMSNMVPQKASLNRDAWRRLEAKVRLWACGEDHISVITGPIELVHLPRLKSGLAIPEQFFNRHRSDSSKKVLSLYLSAE